MNETMINAIKRGTELGYTTVHKHIYRACIDCGKSNWVPFKVKIGKPRTDLCISCAAKRKGEKYKLITGELSPNWKGGRNKYNGGYIRIKIQPDDFFYPMADGNGYIPEHRLVVAKYIRRCLHLWEAVHHINGIKDDNRIVNLQLISEGSHNAITRLERKISLLSKEIKMLKEKLS